MNKILSILAVSTVLTTGTTAQAALLEFDLGGLAPIFGTVAPTGGFVFDTDAQDFSSIGLTTALNVYGDGTGTVSPAGGAGVNQLYGFTDGVAEFVLDLFGFDTTMPGLLPGESGLAAGFGIEGPVAIPFTPFPSEFYNGNVTVTRIDDGGVATVPLPAGLPLLLGALGALGLGRRVARRA